MKLRFSPKMSFLIKNCVTWEEDNTFINSRACVVTSSFRIFLRFEKHSFVEYFNLNTGLSHNLTIVGKTTFEACSFKKSRKMHISKLLYNSSSNKHIIYCTIIFIDFHQKICGYCWYESNWSRGKLHLGHTAYVKNMFGHRTTADVSVVAMYLWKRPKLIRFLLSS